MKLEFKSLNQTGNFLELLVKFHLGFLVFFFFLSSFGLLGHLVLTSQVQYIYDINLRGVVWLLFVVVAVYVI
ncbi:hypothetical protein GLYMA_02G086300v4 [Glycine max]|uniref:Uncharacterized protein n=2 Tax=Glycine subgen. Soja TaxID=1462606 RepID=K7K762_SOYBN|nr:hypothetical protein JHK85_003716 [Glycine max]KAH1059401.1 hypothetical protein GYH30_003428 [Glycine max]KHN15463.1 hypothetical protein glysoja_036331 [Glycine soja]KRH70365.1 hypothetical protein GLYMA_02G086300v4 [Glycine max]